MDENILMNKNMKVKTDKYCYLTFSHKCYIRYLQIMHINLFESQVLDDIFRYIDDVAILFHEYKKTVESFQHQLSFSFTCIHGLLTYILHNTNIPVNTPLLVAYQNIKCKRDKLVSLGRNYYSYINLFFSFKIKILGTLIINNMKTFKSIC